MWYESVSSLSISAFNLLRISRYFSSLLRRELEICPGIMLARSSLPNNCSWSIPLLISTSNCFASVMCERNLSIAWDFACPGSPSTNRFFLVSKASAIVCISSSRSARLSDTSEITAFIFVLNINFFLSYYAAALAATLDLVDLARVFFSFFSSDTVILTGPLGPIQYLL